MDEIEMALDERYERLTYAVEAMDDVPLPRGRGQKVRPRQVVVEVVDGRARSVLLRGRRVDSAGALWAESTHVNFTVLADGRRWHAAVPAYVPAMAARAEADARGAADA
jgi:hypothetical protein